MRVTVFSLLVISVLSLASCRKDKIQPDINQYDETQIQNYITANGLTGFTRDTSGIYYKIINPGTQIDSTGKPVAPLEYWNQVAYVFSLHTLDGTYTQSDTINNHFYDFVGHINNDHQPLGLQMAIHNILKYPDASMRVIIPSHLAYGIDGTGSGSSTVANNRIRGNESLDYYIHAVNNFPKYDDMVIQNYIKANNLTGYSKTADGLWYSILTPNTSTDLIVDNSTITATYTGQLLNGTIFDGAHNGTNTYSVVVEQLIPGVVEGLEKYAQPGTKLSLLIPSSLAYGVSAQNSLPAFSCLRFTWQILTVTP
jgi:FKBP-type peptidyl-prolyl cis-trans isomerase